MPNNPVLTPYHSTTLSLSNRVVMAPMTRYRAREDGVPQPYVADYYAQRASAGLIISEGIWPSYQGQSGWRIPGLVTQAHIRGWRHVTDAVHAAGGRIFAQLMHGGRLGHPLGRIDGTVPAGPSPVPVPFDQRTRVGKLPPIVPREMTPHDITRTVEEYAAAARNAIRAGFDGVELHGANSYLIHQFLADNTNLRTDRYADRTRFPLEVVRAVAEEIGAHRTAIRLSPGNPEFGMVERNPGPVYTALVDELDRIGLAYLHLTQVAEYPSLTELGPRWHGTLIANVGQNGPATSLEAGNAVVRDGLADLVSYGRAFIANPDLVRRFELGAPLARMDERLLYTPGVEGYSDYPALAAELTGACG